jgi:alkylation response protein AidB-like acyl-CoA dehydrogenase
MFDMSFTEEQLGLQKLVREFTQKRVVPMAKELDEKGEFPHELYDEVAEMGLHAMNAPEEFDGPGLDLVTCALLTEELAKGDVGFTVTVNTNTLASGPVLLAGTKAQQKLFYDIVGQGKVAAFCLTEPNAGSDAAAVATTARREGDEYVINGTKCFITCGGVAGLYTVIASVDRSKGLKGLSAFLVERDRPGVSVGKEEDKMGIRSSNTTDVIFQDVRIPVDHLIGKEGEGFKLAMQTLDKSRPLVGALGVGLAQQALDIAVKYAKERVQFGKPIAANQAIQFMLADMAIQIEAARNMVLRACSLYDQGKPFTKESAIAKTLASDIAMKVAVDAVQILGGYGYSKEYPVEKLMRDAKILQIFEGTNQVQRIVIANQLLR